MQSVVADNPKAHKTSPANAVDDIMTHRKRTGAHFTPPELARFVAQMVIDVAPIDAVGPIRVLDPACGDGELLLAFASKLSTHALSRTTISGVELDGVAISEARRRLSAVQPESLDLQEADFLALSAGQRQYRLFDTETPPRVCVESAHFIIANPPYVRTQVLGARKAQELGAAFGLSGRVDLYHAFLVAMTQCLAPGGILGVITSNRFLSTKSGSSIREFLDREYDIIAVDANKNEADIPGDN